MFEKPLARRILFQSVGKQGHALQEAAADRQLKHAAERGGFAIDRRGFRALFPPVQLVAPHGVGRDELDRPPARSPC
jgi:hypothetical protein